MIAIFKRELQAHFKGLLAYLFGVFILIFVGIYTMVYNLSGYYANFEYVLDSVGFIYLITIPVLTMRSVAEEKRQKTDQLLYTLPISLTGVIVGKYLALLAVLLLPILIMALYPLILSQFGTVTYATAYASLFAFFMLGACLISIGVFVSSVTESQVAAAVISLAAMLVLFFGSSLAGFVSNDASASLAALIVLVVIFAVVLYLLAKNVIASAAVAVLGSGALYLWYAGNKTAFSGLFPKIMTELSVFDRFYNFVDGIFDFTVIVYYISIICVFLFMSVQALEKRRWSE